jgi:hypothetical protein
MAIRALEVIGTDQAVALKNHDGRVRLTRRETHFTTISECGVGLYAAVD